MRISNKQAAKAILELGIVTQELQNSLLLNLADTIANRKIRVGDTIRLTYSVDIAFKEDGTVMVRKVY